MYRYVETKHRTKRTNFDRKYVFICEKFIFAIFRVTKCQKCIPGINSIIQSEILKFAPSRSLLSMSFRVHFSVILAMLPTYIGDQIFICWWRHMLVKWSHFRDVCSLRLWWMKDLLVTITAQYSLKISNLSPTHFVYNIFHRHRCRIIIANLKWLFKVHISEK